MAKNILTLVALSSLIAVPAFSKTFKLPNDEFAIGSIAFPSDWEPEEIDNGVAGQSPDSAVYLAAVAVGSAPVTRTSGKRHEPGAAVGAATNRA